MAPTRAGQPGVKLGEPLPLRLMLIVTGFAQRRHPLLHNTMSAVIESLTSAKSTEEFFKHYPDTEISQTPSKTIKPLNGQAA